MIGTRIRKIEDDESGEKIRVKERKDRVIT